MSLSDAELKKFATLLERAKVLEEAAQARVGFLDFVKLMWPGFVGGRHHAIMADAFERIADGSLKRLIINMPPRHTKSEFASFLFPAWLMGHRPNLKILQATHTADLGIGFGRKTRTLMDSEEYKRVFQVRLRSDSKAAYRWQTQEGGEYYATGVGGALAGRGADLAIIDDPHSEQDAMSPAALEMAWDWYQGGPRQRLQPGGAIVIVMTRWSTIDLTAKVLKQSAMDVKADKWEVIEFPAIMPSGGALWPEYWHIDELLATKASMGISKWNAQYMQNPTADEAAIIKKGWWKRWTREKPPKIEYIMQSYDTAFSKQDHADFSAIQTWGVFRPGEDLPFAAILLDARKGRWDFPELKRRALKMYNEWEPDAVLIEAKASGTPLAQELRALGIPVTTFSPSRGNDKMVRVNSVAPLFESGLVWAPETSWADEVIEECAAFPVGENDDMVDCMTQAMMRFRQGGFIAHPEDAKYDEDDKPPVRRVYY